MSGLRFLVPGLVLGALFVLSASARAASISVDENFVIERSYERPRDTEPQHISRRDCLENANVQFPVNIQAESLRPVQIWLGPEPCDSDERRDNEEVCRLVMTLDASSGTRIINITSQELVGEDCVGNQIASTGIQQTLFFAFLDETGRPANNESDTQTISYDMFAPNPPTLNSVGAGDGLLIPEWDVLEVSDLVGYRFYCDSNASVDLSNPEPAQGAGGEGGAASDAGCQNSLVEGSVPDEAFFCGEQAGQQASRGTISGLNNDQTYAVGIVATDFVENVGELSNVICQTPREVTDFYEAYTQAGGKGGGGFCSLGHGRNQAPLSLASLLALGLFLALRRKQRP